jgi:hypothetical protein
MGDPLLSLFQYDRSSARMPKPTLEQGVFNSPGGRGRKPKGRGLACKIRLTVAYTRLCRLNYLFYLKVASKLELSTLNNSAR